MFAIKSDGLGPQAAVALLDPDIARKYQVTLGGAGGIGADLDIGAAGLGGGLSCQWVDEFAGALPASEVLLVCWDDG